MTTEGPRTSPSALVSIAVAARTAGDHELKRAAVNRLRTEHGLRLTFTRPTRPREVRCG